MKLRGIAASLGLATLIFTGSAGAQGMMGGPGYGGPGMGMGPGMMSGQGYDPGMGMGPGMMGGQGFGPGMGMGPGMMGGQGFGPGMGMGPGMMGGQGFGPGMGMGPGMMGGQGFGPGMGMGPGMMGGQGFGPGMGMGPGMMGGQGFGPGMGMGPGMMGGQGFGPCQGAGPGGMWQFLEPDQREDMSALLERHRDAQTERMNQMMELRESAMAQMQETRPDPDAIQELHSRMAQLQGEMMGDRVRLHNAMQDLLTDEQRQQLQQGMPMQRGKPASPSTTE
ncbi:Spy/CpxP family protein refolding chaperone [Halomonas sp. SS10-MC5]|uniref:Spy/CpxP family protein refolding chaperone n=1 Tax=Halomonas sp. SS10-MC5 TaxID=2854257 RepID=UPI0018D1FFD5|nr:Spy/CpxP family protein refolding chaperone [Halomonas sp. SS10-MC5]QPP50736.1 Spy/CpxP family protein refolding chaperone [Halomonas sp. SS10-MC5]